MVPAAGPAQGTAPKGPSRGSCRHGTYRERKWSSCCRGIAGITTLPAGATSAAGDVSHVIEVGTFPGRYLKDFFPCVPKSTSPCGAEVAGDTGVMACLRSQSELGIGPQSPEFKCPLITATCHWKEQAAEQRPCSQPGHPELQQGWRVGVLIKAGGRGTDLISGTSPAQL